MELSWLSSSADILGHGEQEVGGKALGLARLATMEGVRVPAFLVVPASVLDGQALPPSPTAAVLAPLSEALLRDHLNALRHELGPGPYAVRSSMVGEDSKTHSFAGQLHTDLEVELADLPTAFARCWASAFAGGVAQYRERAGLTGPPRMAVVVQAMARGTVSGVAFSADPTT